MKEAKYLIKAGFETTIIFLQHIKYLTEFDEEIIGSISGAKFYPINYATNSFNGFILNCKRLVRKVSLSMFKNSIHFENIFFTEFQKIIKKEKADLYVGHTLGALPIASWAANYSSSKFAFDAEDYHRAEDTDEEKNVYAKKLENKYLNNTAYISAASPFIADHYKINYPTKEVITINNYFPYLELGNAGVMATKKPIKIVWFSQTLGTNRGIVEFLSLLTTRSPKKYELHLRGAHDENVKNAILTTVDKGWQNNIFFYQQCPPEELHAWLYSFDVGLAIEPGFCLNNSIAISNKIFQYLTAGLAIIATATTGQKWVMDQCPRAGFIISDSGLVILDDWEKQ